MAADPTQSQSASLPEARPSAVELIERLSRFDGPPEQFLIHLLAVQCALTGASAGAILRAGPEGRPEVLAVYPVLTSEATAPVWLAQAAESAAEVFAERSTTVRPLREPDELYGQPARSWLVMVPLMGGAGVRGLAAFVCQTEHRAALEESRDRLELTVSLLSLYEMRLTLQRRQRDLKRVRSAMELLATVNENDRITGAAMALCNEVAARWQCERVGLGFLKGRYVKLKALSHTEKFSRKMKLVQDIESVMEECLDQDVEVVYPTQEETLSVNRAARELSRRHGPTAIVSLPMRKGGEPVAVLTAERPVEQPFDIEEVESLRLTCELGTARLVNLYEHDKWFGARAAGAVRKAAAAAVGPKHTWIKLAGILVFLGVMALVFIKGDLQAEGEFVVEAQTQRVVQAPFDGFLGEVPEGVEPGYEVAEGGLLARLRTEEIEQELIRAKERLLAHETEADDARAAVAAGEEKQAELQIAEAKARGVRAEIRLLEERLRDARITSPIAGKVVTGDLHRLIGAPVKKGDVLFEVADLSTLRAVLSIPEDNIADVREGQTGELATKSDPGRKIPFVVEHVSPVAEVVEQKNVFKVRVKFREKPDWLRPGMEGVGKVKVGRAPYLWIFTRRLVNWIRMKLWI